MSSPSVHSAGDFSPSEVAAYYAARLPKLQQRGREWRCPCPIHNGAHDSFSVNAETGMWYCHSQCGRGGSMFDLEMTLSNAEFPAAANEVRRIVGRPALRQVDREPELKWGLPGWSHQYLRERIEKIERENGWRHSAIYPCFFADGRLSYVKGRFMDKQKRQNIPDLGDHVQRWLGYPEEVWQGALAVQVEHSGRRVRDLHLQRREGGRPRCGRPRHRHHLHTGRQGQMVGRVHQVARGKVIRIVVDRDEKGELHGKVVSEALVRNVAEVKIIRLPGLPPKGDLWDWIAAGGTRDQLNQIVANAPVVEVPPAATSEPESQGETSPPENDHSPHCAGDTASSTPRLWSFPYSDSGNAERILARHGQDIRYCHPQKTWHIYDDVRWCSDRRGRMMHIAKCIARALYEEAAEIGDDDARKACADFAHRCESTDRKKAALVPGPIFWDLVLGRSRAGGRVAEKACVWNYLQVDRG